jgi:2-oxoisovalerate dehydrogenase E1 component
MGADLLIATFGNGVHLGRRAMARLADHGVQASLLDLRWLVPLPVEQLTRLAADFDRVLVVDETRHAAGVGEGVISALVEAGYRGRIGRVASRDSYIPIGPAADLVLLGEDEIVTAARNLTDVD